MGTPVAKAFAWLASAAMPIGQLGWGTRTVIVVAALMVWPALRLFWGTARWLVDLARPKAPKEDVELSLSNEDYILLNEWGAKWIKRNSDDEQLESKATDLLLTLNGRKAKGTVRFSQAGRLKRARTLAIPERIARKLGVNIVPDARTEKISVRVARRFPIERYWNNADPSIRASFRTSVWLAIITTAVSTLVSIGSAWI